MNFQERIENRRQGNLSVVNTNEEEKAFDCEYCGIDNMRNVIYMFDLGLTFGEREAISYAEVKRVQYKSAEEIIILTRDLEIKIIGRDLRRLYDYLKRHRITYIQAHTGTDIAETGLFVKEIEVNELL